MSQNRHFKGLLIAYCFPPLNSIATHRMHSFAKYLNNDEFTLDVICPHWAGDLNLDTTGMNVMYSSQRVLDTNYGKKIYTGLSKLRIFIFNKIFKRNYFISRHPGSFYKEVVTVLDKINPGDYDFIITSYGTLDSIHVGRYVKEKFPAIKWIIDYRDMYSLMEYYDMGIFRFCFKNYEKKITRSADGFITVSKVLKEKQEQLLRKKGEIVYNGFDEYQFKVDEKIGVELNAIGLPVISYVGSLYDGERDIVPFLSHFKSEKLDEKFSCVFALINDFDEQYLYKIIADLGVKNVITMRNLNYDQSLTLQKYSAFLLLLTSFNGRGNGFLTGKVFEYIASNKPIVYSGTTDPDFELYQLILKYNLGETFEKIDYQSPMKYVSLDSAFFSRKNQADILKVFLNKIMLDN